MTTPNILLKNWYKESSIVSYWVDQWLNGQVDTFKNLLIEINSDILNHCSEIIHDYHIQFDLGNFRVDKWRYLNSDCKQEKELLCRTELNLHLYKNLILIIHSKELNKPVELIYCDNIFKIKER